MPRRVTTYKLQANMTEAQAREVIKREYGDDSSDTIWRAFSADTVRTSQVRLAALGLLGQYEFIAV